MGNRTKIIASVFPKSCESLGSNKLKLTVHVFLTFRLPDTRIGTHDQMLKDYFHIWNWTDFLQVFQSRVTFSIYDPSTTPVLPDIPAQFVQLYNSSAKDLWRKMFPEKTTVFGWVLDDTPFRLAESLTSEAIRERIRNAIDNCIISITNNPSLIDPSDPDIIPGNEAIARLSASNLSRYLEELREKPIGQIIIDPILRDAKSRPGLQGLFDELIKINDDFTEELNQRSLEFQLREAESRNYEETIEFHKRYSAYSNHPELLKKVGCILEYNLEINTTQWGIGVPRYIRMGSLEQSWRAANVTGLNLNDNTDITSSIYSFFQEVDFRYPFTFSQFDRINGSYIFRCSPKSENIQGIHLEENYGIVKVKGSANNDYEISAELVDKNQALQKIRDVLNFDDRLRDTARQRAGTDTDMQRFATSIEERNLLNTELNQTGGIAEYLSSGITVSIKNLKDITRTTINNDPEKTRPVPTPGEISPAFIFAENAFGGYRIDVAVMPNRNGCKLDVFNDLRATLGSLCRVNEKYDDQPEVQCEGIISETAQVSRSGKLFVDEELFRWNDWSLVAPQPGNFNYNPGVDKDKLKIEVWPQSRSLVPLRFGTIYRFRLRLVDICGHSVDPVRNSNEVNDNDWTTGVNYQRVDPINTPFLVSGTPLLKKGKESFEWVSKHWGEDTLTLVTRSREKNGRLVNDGENTIRYIGPPKANFNFVLQHGVLDELLGSPNPDQFRNELLNLADARLDDSPDFVLKRQQELDYLFDPLTTGFKMIMDSKVVNFPYPSPVDSKRYWKGRSYFRISLSQGNSFDWALEAGNPQGLEFEIPQGMEKPIDLGCDYDTTVCDRNRFYPKIPISKYCSFKLVHATQKPCLLEEQYVLPSGSLTNFMEEINTSGNCRIYFKRSPNKSDCNLSLGFDRFPALTSESYLLHVAYAEITCDRTSSTGLQVNLVNRVVKSGFHPEKPAEKDVIFSDLLHFFDNTKHYSAYYRIEAVSKFKKYFDPTEFDGKPNAFSVFSKLPCADNAALINKLNPCSTLKEVLDATAGWPSVPSTARPEMPVIDRIAPLIRWDISEDRKTASRYCDSVRIYFTGDWFSSGIGEKVAVMFLEDDKFNSSNVLSLDNNCIGSTLDKVISQFGTDPAAAAQTIKPTTDYVVKKNFFTGRILPDAADGNDICLTKMEFEKDDSTAANLSQYSLNAAIYDIEYDCPCAGIDAVSSGEGQFFVDVKIDRSKLPKSYYTPFIRLAIARYQENSIPQSDIVDYRFSRIVVTDFIQLLPYRKVQIQPNKILYEGFARRKSGAGAWTNELYLFNKNNELTPDNETTLTREFLVSNITSELAVSDAGIIVDSDNMTIPNLRGTDNAVIINEYEVYKTPVTIATTDPRNNYSRRLIFSYIYEPQKNIPQSKPGSQKQALD